MSSLRRVYDTHLREYTESVGIHGSIAVTYEKTKFTAKQIRKSFFGEHPKLEIRIRHLASRDETVTHDIDGVVVEFPIEEYWQYKRFRWMHAERELFEDLIEELSSDDVFYDVGAHLGWHTVVVANLDADVDIVSFEPHPITAERLETVVNVTGHDAEIHEIALYDREGTVEFTKRPTSGAKVSASGGAIETVRVPTRDGDTLIREEDVSPPDVLKIDAEGAEANVLRGFRETILSHRPRLIYCEIHEDDGEAGALLDDLGYEYEPFDTGRPIVKAEPQ